MGELSTEEWKKQKKVQRAIFTAKQNLPYEVKVRRQARRAWEFWPDGCNMNLTRNHIISYKRDIAELCEENGMPLPEEYFLKIPPEVDDNYMANLKQKARVERLKQQGDRLNQKKQKFVDDGQLEFC